MSRAVVLIIVHKQEISELEQLSLQQCKRILGDYKIVLICPAGLNISAYRAAVPGIEADFINPKWQANYAMFNRLKISPLLYEKYKQYDYILYYELDAWVFRNELEYWCNQGYDYIGAPWFEGWSNATPDSKFLGVGNGGFSLRKVKSHLRVLNSFSYINPAAPIIKDFFQHLTPGRLKRIFVELTVRNNTYKTFNDYSDQEDWFWGLVATRNFKWFRVPDEQTALRFSVEVNPASYIKSAADLPFGCHGWWKYNADFWRKYIDVSK